MDLNSEGLDIVRAIRTPGEIGQVKLNLVPALIESHRHSTDERLDSSGGLVVGCTEPAADILVVEHLDLEGEVLLQILDDHHKERQLDPQSLLRVRRSCDVVR